MSSVMAHQEYFDRLASGWDERMPSSLRQAVERFIGDLGLSQGSAVLDLGTGTGVAIGALQKGIGPAGRLVALDISRQMLGQATRQDTTQRVAFVQADGAALPFINGTFDAVLCQATFPHFQDKAGALREMWRVLKTEGRIWIAHLNGRQRTNAIHQKAGGAIGQDYVPDAAEMETLLTEAGFAGISVVDEPSLYLATALRPA